MTKYGVGKGKNTVKRNKGQFKCDENPSNNSQVSPQALRLKDFKKVTDSAAHIIPTLNWMFYFQP